MLETDDFASYISAYNDALAGSIEKVLPSEILNNEKGMFPTELAQLISSLYIAAAAGDIPKEAAACAQIILDSTREVRCAPVRERSHWATAIAWALAELSSYPSKAEVDTLTRRREISVGQACKNLRRRGYKVDINTFGAQIEQRSNKNIINNVKSLIGLIGGQNCLSQILHHLKSGNSYHDGIWLFGEVGLGLYGAPKPMLPVGWLFSLAIGKLHCGGRARKPEIAWRSLVQLASDFAAVHDCQTYSQYMHFNIHPSQFHSVIYRSTIWRELFTLPQVPPKTLWSIIDALRSVLNDNDRQKMGCDFSAFLKEIQELFDLSCPDKLTVFERNEVEARFPIFTQVTGGAARGVNADYGEPFDGKARTHDSVLLFASAETQAITLPQSFFASNVCEYVFRSVWSKLGADRAGEVVGSALEVAIANACRNKTQKMLAGEEYYVGSKRYEIDVATRDGDKIALIEVKGKSLTQKARSGNMFAFFEDYTDSFLSIFEQLIRHEINLRSGHTPLTEPDEYVQNLRPVKVAVSPLSYGPVSDKILASSMLRSLVGAKFNLIQKDRKNQNIIDKFNELSEKIIADMANVAPKEVEKADLLAYLIDVFWLDLGQLLYILDRAYTVWDAFRPLKHITFSSRDFWTELAYADRQQITAGKWRPVT